MGGRRRKATHIERAENVLEVSGVKLGSAPSTVACGSRNDVSVCVLVKAQSEESYADPEERGGTKDYLQASVEKGGCSGRRASQGAGSRCRGWQRHGCEVWPGRGKRCRCAGGGEKGEKREKSERAGQERLALETKRMHGGGAHRVVAERDGQDWVHLPAEQLQRERSRLVACASGDRPRSATTPDDDVRVPGERRAGGRDAPT